MKKKILVLGSTGMLGSMVYGYLSRNKRLEVTGTDRDSFEVNDFLENNSKYSWLNEYDYIINCIGIIKPYCRDDDPNGVVQAIRVNALFPHELSTLKPKIIQIATDCVFSGTGSNLKDDETHDAFDVYGKTKSLGEVFYSERFLNIRCSIIGPEKDGSLSLLGWFLSQPKGSTLTGFNTHYWNGVTTLQFSQLCEHIIIKNKFDSLRKLRHTLNYVPNERLTKYEMLVAFKKIFKRDYLIIKADYGPIIDRSLMSDIKSLLNPRHKKPFEKALIDLNKYMEDYA